MSELDEAWALALNEAEQRARSSGRSDIADYLSLRNSNDLLRQTGCNWLLDTFVMLAADANRNRASIQTHTTESYRFKVRSSTMVGRLLTLSFGERQLFVEAGWPRTPRDGFVPGGGLARANIRHRGMRSADLELRLVQSNKGAPQWFVLERGLTSAAELHESTARDQIRLLLDDRFSL